MKTVITLCCNEPYLEKCYKTLSSLRSSGQYTGDIVFFHDKSLIENTFALNKIKNEYNCITKEFPELDLSRPIDYFSKVSGPAYPTLKRIFQYFKFYMFHSFFKQWDRVLFLDCNIHIYDNINRVLSLNCNNKILAQHSAYPTYSDNDVFGNQFNLTLDENISNSLKKNFDLTRNDFFLSTFLYFDTSIIENDTVDNLIRLMNIYPIAIHTDQTIINLYFHYIQKKIAVMPYADKIGWLCDFHERPNLTSSDYVLLKYPNHSFNW